MGDSAEHYNAPDVRYIFRASLCISKLDVSIHASLAFAAPVIDKEKDVVGTMLSTSIGMMLISGGIVSFRDDAFVLSLSVGAVETTETVVENLDHSDRLRVDI